jgi:hypothetical protein
MVLGCVCDCAGGDPGGVFGNVHLESWGSVITTMYTLWRF